MFNIDCIFKTRSQYPWKEENWIDGDIDFEEVMLAYSTNGSKKVIIEIKNVFDTHATPLNI